MSFKDLLKTAAACLAGVSMTLAPVAAQDDDTAGADPYMRPGDNSRFSAGTPWPERFEGEMRSADPMRYREYGVYRPTGDLDDARRYQSPRYRTQGGYHYMTPERLRTDLPYRYYRDTYGTMYESDPGPMLSGEWEARIGRDQSPRYRTQGGFHYMTPERLRGDLPNRFRRETAMTRSWSPGPAAGATRMMPGGGAREMPGRNNQSAAPAAQPNNGVIDIVAHGYDYDPERITVRPGERVTVKLINRCQMPHNIEFELPGGEVELEDPLSPGQTGTLSFTAPTTPGEYTFYCPVGNHHEKGMEGTLIVRG